MKNISIPSDLRLFFTVIAAGALGSLIHGVTSFADYVGNRSLGKSWVWWLVLRTPLGVAIALLFYLVLRGGLIVPQSSTGGSGVDATRLLNPYGIAAISAMAGMFSKQATDKLREIFDTLFRTREPVNRADPLGRVAPEITGAEPAKLTIGGAVAVDIIGRGFQPDCTATVNDKPRKVKRSSAVRLTVTLDPADIAAAGKLQLKVQNPGANGGDSAPFELPVEQPPAA